MADFTIKRGSGLRPRYHADGLTTPFAYWLAGFIDGEGCFSIRRLPRGNWCCAFSIALRDDDQPVLEEIMDRTGLGTVCRQASGKGDGFMKAVWSISSKADCLALVAILDEHPLRAKKARDFVQWREAVVDWGTATKGRHHDWTNVAFCRDALIAGRRHPARLEA